ncbi:hypothetical protein [Legionella israelensis]|uniref:hypothetical protein n=1 Tax=Legionella israelensis TaxID=454 RepID=UPI001FD7B568|nr:hypothetical protein [Legionella israelensis]
MTQDHSNREQLRLNRALRAFIDEGIIIKVAHGLCQGRTHLTSWKRTASNAD